MPRVYETIAVLLLLAVLVFGLAVLALAFFDNDDSAQVCTKEQSSFFKACYFIFDIV